jgi:predicted PurR-regulated permease PerM
LVTKEPGRDQDAVSTRRRTGRKSSTEMRLTAAEFFKRTLIVVAVVLVPVLVWYLFDVVMVVLGAIMIALLLHVGAEPVTRWCRLPQWIALVVSALLIFAVLAAAGYLFGSRISAELQNVINRVSEAQENITATLNHSKLGAFIVAHIQGGSLSLGSALKQVFTVTAGFLEGLVIAVIGGAYLAAQPSLYRDGLLMLFPRRMRGNVSETIDDVANALRLWMLAQLIQMAAIGLISYFAVWLIGLPSPLALGFIAAICEFVPYVGPIISAIPAVLVAASQSGHAMFWTVIAYLAIHQLEGNLFVPLIQQHMVFIPPALVLLGIVVISFLFGPLATIFAAPIAVAIFVLIKKLYVRDSLGERTAIPGEPG